MKPLSELDIIETYFTQRRPFAASVICGPGDDAAVLHLLPGEHWVTTVDTLNENIHFFPEVAPFDLGYKSLAVSVSDIAAMAARPVSALLSLTLPRAEKKWIEAFSAGFFTLADALCIDLIGGDLTRGPLAVTTVVHGLVPQGAAVYRSGAQIGDLIYVSGTLGDAGCALSLLRNKTDVQAIHPALISKLLRPVPRVDIGLAIRGIAQSAIDISDGLLKDLGRICQASHVGAVIQADKIPLSTALQQNIQIEKEQAWEFALTAGDDYELLFTIPAACRAALERLHLDVHCIGSIVDGSGVNVYDVAGRVVCCERTGYDHFAL